jgi:hypothetical protein
MKTERPDGCREWRHLLGAYALGDLGTGERAGLEAHLEGCAECWAEAESLEGVAATIGRERQVAVRRRRWRFGFALGGATAAVAAALLAIVVLPGGNSSQPAQHVEFASLPAGVKIDATLEPHPYGTEIRMYVKGVRSGTLCRVYLRGPRGERVPAGTFTYRWGDDSEAVLSSALDLSRTRAIGVHAGNRTFVAPVDVSGATARATSNQEDVT